MIKVLQNWLEIGEADKFLIRNTLPKHAHSIEKNWDLYQLYTIVKSLPQEIKIIDLGCGSLSALKLLYAMGFKNLYGIDLSMPLWNRLNQIYIMWKSHSLKLPFHLYSQDLTKTSFPERAFDLAICVSVIEHGVDMDKFFMESKRLLKPGGILFITTDYWEEAINIPEDNRPFGLGWKVFSKEDIKDIILRADRFNFSLRDNPTIPACQDKCIIWNNQEYTFLAVAFNKEKTSVRKD